jgi:hypothetical protein
MYKHYHLEIELNGAICAKRMLFERKPTDAEARQHFEGMGYSVGSYLRFS